MLEIDPSAGYRYVPELGREVEVTYNYTKHASRHPIRRWMVNGFYKEMLRIAHGIQPESILDFGCGEGYTLDRLARAKVSTYLAGFDGSAVAVNLGKQLFPDLKLHTGNIYQAPYADNSADLVICTEVLEHLEKPRQAIQEMARVSKRHLLLSVPNEPYFSLKNLAIGRNVRRWGSTKSHLNWWTSGAFEKFVTSERLKILSVAHPFPFTLLLAEK